MDHDVEMLDARPPPARRRTSGSKPSTTSPPASSTSTGASRHSSLAALMNPEPEPEPELKRDPHETGQEDSEHEGEPVVGEDADNDDEEQQEEDEEVEEEEDDDDDEGSSEEEDEEDEDSEEGDDSTKDSILIAGGNAPSTAATGVPDDSSTAAAATKDSSRSISIPVLIHPDPAQPNSDSPVPVGSGPEEKVPSVSVPPAPAPSKPVSSAKPRSKHTRTARSPSPSPPPPPPPPPLSTIRLEIKLGGPTNYEVDITKLAKETGQRPPTPPPKFAPNKNLINLISESEADTDTGKKKKKKKRKNPTSDYYDVNDPFIDDSELALDERTYFAQTKQQGFYVSSGEVALLKDNTPKKPRSKKISLATALNIANGTASAVKKEDDHIGAADESDKNGAKGEDEADGEKVGQKRKRYITVVENGKKRKVVDETSFHPELQAAIEKMKEAIKSEDWSQKGKFPPTLKPQLAQLALQAIKLDEYDEHFFNLMPVLFPYNKFTMSKLIKRTVFADHIKLLHDRQEELLSELKVLVDEGFQKAEEEWTKSVLAWDKRQEKARLENQTDSAAPTRHPTEEMEVEGSTAGPPAEGADGKKDGKDNHPPYKRYRLTEQMKNIVWQLVLLSNECCRLENEKNTLEGSVITVSEQGLRKNLYQKIVAVFPEGWMTSSQISRDVSAMKKKYEKEAMESEA